MAKDDFWKAVLIVGGLALLAKVLEEAKKNENKIYRCWRCQYILNKAESCCPNCGAPQDWRGIK